MAIYIDTDYKCHAEPGEGLTAVETDFFDGREALIPSYRFVPEGQNWTRADGTVFAGEMIAPWSAGDTNTELTEALNALSEIEEALNA